MNARKPRLLLTNECSYLSTGYGGYGKAVQQILHDSGKYEVAELAAFHDPTKPADVERAEALPWKVFSNIPADPGLREAYNPDSGEKHGGFSFNQVALDFRPDVVWGVRDHWMDEFPERSPFRKFFHWAWMPTVDAVPQPKAWLSSYASVDAVFSYSDWGADVLRREGGGLINVRGSAPPCADLDVFRPLDRAALRAKYGVPSDALVVGSVMRNQPRKLFPDLIHAFGVFLETADRDVSDRSLLYLHTSYPDQGWEIPALIRDSGFSRKILVTYLCRRCQGVTPMRYSDARAVCHHCNALAAAMPHVRAGVSPRQLAEVMNLFDVFAQYSNSEGFGMPQVEAAACGVPVLATDYSAMSDVVRKVNGYPIKVDRYLRETVFGCDRALPCPHDFAAVLRRHFALGPEGMEARGREARAGVLAHYTWERTASRWMAVFDGFPLRDHSETWDSPIRLHTPKQPPPNAFSTTEEVVRWYMVHYLGRPDLVGTYSEMRLVRDLVWGGRTLPTGGSVDFSETEMMAEMAKAVEAWNYWERKRRPAVG